MPDMTEKALIIIPTYNEKENIRKMIEMVLAQDPRIDMLIVDDNSPDKTGDIVDAISKENPRVNLMRRPGKMGLGTAYRDGFAWALERPQYEYIFEMDADFSHDPNHLPMFLDAAQSADFVLGSRYLNGNVTVTDWPMTRLLLSYGANVYVSRLNDYYWWENHRPLPIWYAFWEVNTSLIRPAD